MKLSTRMRYGTRALLDLALREDDGPVSLKNIANRQGISLKYLERIFSCLQVSGLVHGVRGACGGYRLARSPAMITLRQMYESLEGQDPVVGCTAHPQACSRAETCVTQQVWSQLNDICMETLDSITLDDLVRRAQ
jgi:Rrf2 family cysteine metabolism transcriptional repressor